MPVPALVAPVPAPVPVTVSVIGTTVPSGNVVVPTLGLVIGTTVPLGNVVVPVGVVISSPVSTSIIVSITPGPTYPPPGFVITISFI